MRIEPGVKVLISQTISCHNGEVGTVHKVTSLGALVRVRDCVHLFNRSNLRPVPEPDVIPVPVAIMCGDYSSGDQVVWSAGPVYGSHRGPGVIQGFVQVNGILYVNVRWDDAGLDDEDVPLVEIRRES